MKKKLLYNKVEEINRYALKKGVFIFLDTENTSQEADMGAAYSYNPKIRFLTIVINLLTEEEKRLVQSIIVKLHNEGELIFKSSKQNTLVGYQSYNEKNQDQKTLEFFKEILNKDDYSALKMSLFIRFLMKSKKPVSIYKQDIREKFGERGANIANLCTAGYFEEEFIPFYNDYSAEEFFDYYELAVGKKARALFIHSSMTTEMIEIEFDKILSKAIKYHMVDFRVHALGAQNVRIIKDFFKTIDSKDYNIVWKKKYERIVPALVIEYVVTILYKD